MATQAQTYKIAWICTLPFELVIAREMLDMEHDGPAKDPHDSNTYIYGVMKGHYIVIIGFTSGRYELTSSAALMSSLYRSFPNLSFCLLVGIGGGAPSNEHDIRLGDVVVGVSDDKSGVIQLHYNRNGIHGERQPTLSDSLPAPLLDKIWALQASQRAHGYHIQTELSKVPWRSPQLQAKFQAPSADQDRLYAEAVDGGERLVQRVERKAEDNPTVHYGAIASSDQVVKSRRLRDELAFKYNVLCFEMEAAGLLSPIPALIIRGICDYSDKRKTDVWRPYAAATAAMYAKQLLGVISPSDLENITATRRGHSEPGIGFGPSTGDMAASLQLLRSLILRIPMAATTVLRLESSLFILDRAMTQLLSAGIHPQSAQARLLDNLLVPILYTMQRIGSIMQNIRPEPRLSGQLLARRERTITDLPELYSLVQELCYQTDELVTSASGHGMIPSLGLRPASSPVDDMIVVMGQTGSGKSHFIQKATGSSDIALGHTLESETLTIAPYSASINGRTVTLIDTPGFDDTQFTDAEVLKELAAWLSSTFSQGYSLSGILYLSPITATRMNGSAKLGLDVFKNLVGEASYSKVLLVTTMWDVVEMTIGEQREVELKERFWQHMLTAGSRSARSFGDSESATTIIKALLSGEAPAVLAPLAIQREMVNEEKALAETSAGQVFAAQIEALEASFQEQLRINAVQNKHNQDLQAQIDSLREERELLRVGFQKEVHVHLEGFLPNEPPPPYEPSKKRRGRPWLQLIELVMFWVLPIISAMETVTALYRRFTRPKLKDGFSRVEWTCECGEELIADMVEMSEGSLSELAKELNGKLTGPAARQHATGTSPGASNSTIAAGSGLDAGGAGSSDLAPGPSRVSGKSSTTHSELTSTQSGSEIASNHLFLELCIPAGEDIHNLEELDIARRGGSETDQEVFLKIRTTYDRLRQSRILSVWKPRLRKGGVFVKFCRDRRARSAEPALASVFEQCMPSKEEAERFKYKFIPVPANKPPMPAPLINHYISNPHKAETEAIWVKRFPKLAGPSLKFSDSELPEGWGIEIIEVRNWKLFAFTNAIVIFLSGLIAGICGWVLEDKAIGIAVGSWLTAIDAIVVNTTLWIWTNG